MLMDFKGHSGGISTGATVQH